MTSIVEPSCGLWTALTYDWVDILIYDLLKIKFNVEEQVLLKKGIVIYKTNIEENFLTRPHEEVFT